MYVLKHDATKGATVLILSWLCGYTCFSYVFNGLSAASNYSLISAWWLTAYILAKFPVKPIALLLVFLFAFSVSFGSSSVGLNWFYKGVEDVSKLELAVMSVFHSLMVCSPWFFDFLFKKSLFVISRSTGRTQT